MTPFWLSGWAFAVAVAWLLPNHYLPWAAFHMDAWMGIVLLLASAAVIVRSTGPVVWHGISIITAAIILIPGLQYAGGMMLSSGTAWISALYLLGFLLALLTGARWESVNPGQVADGLFLAIGIGALASVGLELHQWLSLDLMGIWSMGPGFGRPFANFGQPNQLATFLLWGTLAMAWGYVREKINVSVALLGASYLLFGLALTQSRTSWLAVVILVGCSWLWRRLWPSPRLPWVVTGLALYFAACSFLIWQTLSGDAGLVSRLAGESRPVIWALFVDALLQRPWWGYGWSQLGMAQIAAALGQPALHVLFFHSHNLFLDLMLWCGIPIGLFLSIYLTRWFWLRFRGVRDAREALLVLLLLVIANHAMLELPLHYGYFLFPVGLVMGALDARMNARPAVNVGRLSFIAVWVLASALLTLVIRDYYRVEISYLALRFEWAGVKTPVRGSPPDVLLLTQWYDFIKLSRFEPTDQLSAADLDWITRVTNSYPTVGFFHKLAAALAMNGRPEEASTWLKKMCKIVPEPQCAAVKAAWANQSLRYPSMAKVIWEK